ncbi:hypothetical protein ACE3MZ_19145 [Paenibacillus sp. WLX1005]|uniref:hypothetical protein n=1 Tax=Paenibacillus sp. WLX1005 TaxID=3243766 RepID=UPI003983EB63
MGKTIERIRSFLRKWLDRDQDHRIKWAEVYLAIGGVFHRALVETPRKRAAARRQESDLPVSRIREIPLEPGDILYTPSSESTYYAGHMGILGTDGRVYHVHPFGPVFSDTVEWYVKRFYVGDRFVVFRARHEDVGVLAAEWAEQYYKQVKAYRLHTGMDDVTNNYCSKFIDQAYRFTSGTDIWGKGKRKIRHGYIYPFRIVKSAELKVVGTYYRA